MVAISFLLWYLYPPPIHINKIVSCFMLLIDINALKIELKKVSRMLSGFQCQAILGFLNIFTLLIPHYLHLADIGDRRIYGSWWY